MKKYIEILNNMPLYGSSANSFKLTSVEGYIELIKSMPKEYSNTKTDTIARIFNRSRDENFISDWLSYIIQNEPRFLTEIFNHLDIEIEIKEYEVIREYVFANGRRIDLFVESDNFVLGIENKVDAGLQKSQLRDYNRQIASIKKDRDVILIYLVPDSNNAQESDNFIKITYEQLHSILKKINLNFVDNLRLSFYIFDFIKHIEENFMSNDKKFEYNEWTQYLGEYSKEIKVVIDSGKKERINIMEYLQNEMLKLVDSESEQWKCSRITPSISYIQLYKVDWKQDLDIHFELSIKDSNILPTECAIRIDIEGRVPVPIKDDAMTKLGTNRKMQEVSEVFTIDYSSEESYYGSVELIMDTFNAIIKQYTQKIDSIYKNYHGEYNR